MKTFLLCVQLTAYVKDKKERQKMAITFLENRIAYRGIKTSY